MKKNVAGLFFLVCFCISSGITAENKEAREFGLSILNKYAVKCGDCWYVGWAKYQEPVAKIYELKDLQRISFPLFETSLDQADKLNGWEFKGKILCNYANGPIREYDVETQKWSKWYTSNRAVEIIIEKRNGVWSTKDEEYKTKISCTDIPKNMPPVSEKSETTGIATSEPNKVLPLLIQALKSIVSADNIDIGNTPNERSMLIDSINGAKANLGDVLKMLSPFKNSVGEINKVCETVESCLSCLESAKSEYAKGGSGALKIREARGKLENLLDVKARGTTPTQPKEPEVNYSEADLITSLKKAQRIITGGKDYTVRWLDVPNSSDRKKILQYLDDAISALNSSEIIARSLSIGEALNVISQCKGRLERDRNSYNQGRGGEKGLRDAYWALRTYLKGK